MSRYVPEKLAGVDQATMAFEGEIRELIRRDAAFPSRQRSEGDAAANAAAENVNTLIRASLPRRRRKLTVSFLSCRACATCCAAKANA